VAVRVELGELRACPDRERRGAKIPEPPANGPKQVQLPDGTIAEWSAAIGRSVIVPGTPSTKGIDVRADAPAWGGKVRRRLLGR
jgi:hypothetical protein